jgi:hypothetical protein
LREVERLIYLAATEIGAALSVASTTDGAQVPEVHASVDLHYVGHSLGARHPLQDGPDLGAQQRHLSVQDKARAAWQPGISVKALQSAAGISRPSTQKYHAQFLAEQRTQEAAQ